MSSTNDPNEDNLLDDGSTGDDQWTRTAGNGDTHDELTSEPEVYTTKTEREVAFKLIAAHALVDAKYYQLLRENPREAVGQLHFLLDEDDYRYLEGKTSLDERRPGINWDAIDPVVDQLRSGLNQESVVRSLW